MGYGIILLAGLMGGAILYLMGRQSGAFAHMDVTPLPARHTSPLDEAERILTLRYAKGEITPEEFARMLAILRR